MHLVNFDAIAIRRANVAEHDARADYEKRLKIRDEYDHEVRMLERLIERYIAKQRLLIRERAQLNQQIDIDRALLGLS